MKTYTIEFQETVRYRVTVNVSSLNALLQRRNEIIDDGDFDVARDCSEVLERDLLKIVGPAPCAFCEEGRIETGEVCTVCNGTCWRPDEQDIADILDTLPCEGCGEPLDQCRGELVCPDDMDIIPE